MTISKFNSKTILVVDDEPDLREVIREECELKGYRVFEASNGNDAYSVYKKEKIDIIITDLRMSGGSGLELLEKLRKENPEFPFVFLITGYSELTESQAYHKGANAVFSKPIDFDKLFISIENILLSPKLRWGERNERKKVNFEINILNNESNNTKSNIINIGRGGFFIHLKEEIPKKNEIIKFNIIIDTSSNIILTGNGIVRWIRMESTAEAVRGCGVEFQELDPQSIEYVLGLIDKMNSQSFIPET